MQIYEKYFKYTNNPSNANTDTINMTKCQYTDIMSLIFSSYPGGPDSK